jgi:riboflavin synthase
VFSGLVQGMGRVQSLVQRTPADTDVRMTLALPPEIGTDVELGESINVRGCCLTVVSYAAGLAEFDVSLETLRVTAGFAAGQVVNLERSLTLATRLGGHLVTGHVDGVGKVLTYADVGGSWKLDIAGPRELAKYVARKGSIAVDGVSLTVNSVSEGEFSLNIIPHTRAVTTLGGLVPGGRVNLEVDLIARYVERMLSYQNTAQR